MSGQEIFFVVVVLVNGVIGVDGVLFWYLFVDLCYFKLLMMGLLMVMGCKIFDLLFGLLFGCCYIVIICDFVWEVEGVEVVYGLDVVIVLVNVLYIVVIGGGEIFVLVLLCVNCIELIEVVVEVVGDICMLLLGEGWYESFCEVYEVENGCLVFVFVMFKCDL